MILYTIGLIDLPRETPEAEEWLDALPSLPTISGLAALEALFGAKSSTDMRKVHAYLQPFPTIGFAPSGLRRGATGVEPR